MAKNYVNFNEAVLQAFKYVKKTSLTEIVGIDHALGRVFSQDILCQKNLPSFNNSAMDGFAVKAADAGKTLKIKEIVYAGDVQASTLKEGECYKIMTGAQVPGDADSIVPVENVVSFENNEVTLPDDIPLGYAVRLKGEEVKEDAVLFHKGEEITSRTIAVLASQGLINLEVFKKLSIAVVSTGSELKEPWEDASEDEIYNCNSY